MENTEKNKNLETKITPAQIKALAEEMSKINKKIDFRNPIISESNESLVTTLMEDIRLRERELDVDSINKQKHISSQNESESEKMKRLMTYRTLSENKE